MGLPLRLDDDGLHVLREWIASARPSTEDLALVEEVLDAFAWQRGVTRLWYTRRDVATGDLIVVPREGLRLVIRPFGQDAGLFSLTLVDDYPDRDDD